jgi:exopolysaccharide production protein ExoQ
VKSRIQRQLKLAEDAHAESLTEQQMATQTITIEPSIIESPVAADQKLSIKPTLRQGIFMWLLLLPMFFFATHGYLSFQGEGDRGVNITRATSATPKVHEHGALGTIMPLVAYGIIMCALLFNIRGVLHLARQSALLTFLSCFTIVSALWSQNPLRTLYFGGFFLVGTLFAYYLVLRYTPEEIMTMLMRVGVLVFFLGLVMVFLFPRFGVANGDPRAHGAWIGIFIDRVSSAKCCVFLLSPALVWTVKRSRWKNLTYAMMMLTFIFMAKAVTALAVTFTFMLIMVLIQGSRRLERKTALFLGAVVGLLAITFFFAGDTIIAEVLALFGRNMTLTGRTAIWSILMGSIAKSPWLGYGFYAFWQGMEGESANVILAAHWFFGYAHNGLIEIVLQLGFVGLALFIATFVMACRNAWFCFRYQRTPGTEWYFGLLMLAVLYNLDEETVMWPNDLLSLLYIVSCCGLAMEARRIRAEMAAQEQLQLEPSVELELVAA